MSFELFKGTTSFLCSTTLCLPGKPSASIHDLTESLGIPPAGIARIKQVHSDRIREVSSGEKGIGIPVESDGIILTEPGVFGLIRTADCVPVVLVHQASKTTAIVHAGWKGTCSRITRKAALRMMELTSGSPGEIKVFAGPCIHSCCYEVGTEVKKAFENAGHDLKQLMIGRNLDLVKANLLQVVELGISDISSSGFCTACNPDLFYSYRRNKTGDRMLTLAGFVY